MSRLRKCLRARHSARRKRVAQASKRSRATLLRAHETIARRHASVQRNAVLQLFLSSPNNTHRDDCEFKQIVGSGQKRCFADSEVAFFGTKYFRENLLFARSPLATANFFGIFRKPIRKPMRGARRFRSRAGKTAPVLVASKNGKRTDLTTRESDAERAGAAALTTVQMPSFAFSKSFTACGFTSASR